MLFIILAALLTFLGACSLLYVESVYREVKEERRYRVMYMSRKIDRLERDLFPEWFQDEKPGSPITIQDAYLRARQGVGDDNPVWVDKWIDGKLTRQYIVPPKEKAP